MENNIEKKTKLLVVDDDLSTVVTIRNSLKKYGYSRIGTAKNGEEAIQLVKDSPPDLILMDINLEGELDGIQTSEKINEITEIPIVFVTTNSYDSIMHGAKLVAPYGYLLKPFENLVLYSTIEMALKRFSLEKQLKYSEAKFRALFENSRDAIGVSKNGIHVFANPAYLKLFGFENHDMVVGKSILDCIAPSHQKNITDNVKQRVNGIETPTFYESKGRKTDGSEFDFEINVSTYELDNETYTITNIRDITDRIKVEKEISQSRYFFKDSQSAAFIGSYKTDFISGTWESSEVLDQIFGIDKNYNRSVKGWLDLTHPDDHKMMDIYLQEEIITKRKTFDQDYRIIRKSDGKIRWVHGLGKVEFNNNGNLVSMIGTIQDITDRKQIEEEQRESELRFRELYDNAPVGLYRTTPHGKILLANKALCSMLGYSSFKELSEMDLKKSGYEAPDQRKKFIEEIEKLGEVTDLEAKWKRKDGSKLIVKESAKIIRDYLNNVLYYDGTVEDITERKLIEETQMFLLNSFNTDSSGDFFTSLAVYLAKCLDMDYVCIDKLHENNLAAKTLAIYFDGKFEDNVEYTLKETPCGDVVGKTICCFPQKVRHLFPKDIVLQEMKAESYVGTTLWSSNHQPIGLIAVIGRKPLKNLHLTETILKLVAIRCAGELERRQAEKAILEKEIQYHNLADSGLALIWTSGLDKFCNYFNEPWLKFTGRTLEQEVGNGWAEGVHPEDFDHCLKTYVEAFDKREAFDMEYRLRHVSGEYRWLKDMGVPNYNAAGEFVGYIGHCFDINEQKKTEKTIKDLNERITLATRVAKIGIWDWDITNNVLLWDENMYSLYGRNENEFEGAYEAWLDAINPDEKDRCNLESVLARRGEKDYDTEFRINVPGKGTRYIRAYGDVYRNDKGEPFRMIGVNFDITERKTDELLLKKSEEKFSKAFETSPEAISISAIEDGAYLEVNNLFLKTTGYTKEELIGHTSTEIGIWVDKDARQKYVAELLKQGSLKNLEARYKMKDGEIRDFWVSSEIIELDGKKRSLNFILDVTERKKAEEALRESELRFKQVAENAKEWIWEVDKNGLYTYASKVCKDLLGYDPDEIVGKKYFHDLFIEKDREELKSFAFKTFERKEQFSGLLNVNQHKDGREIILSTSGVPILNSEGGLTGYRGVDVDITKSKLAEEELKSSFSLLNATLESTADGILVVDMNGKINLFNQQFVDMWKIPNELIELKDDKLLLNHVIALVEKPEEFLSKVSELYSKPDESSYDKLNLVQDRVFERFSRPQKIGETVIGRVWSFRDITERRRIRKELEKYQAQLEELVKVRTEELNNVNAALIRKIEKENEFKLMLQHSLEKEKELSEMKSQFISTASHEFRTPLTSILSSAGLLQRYSKQWGEDKKVEHFDRIKNSVSYLTKLLDDVLTINRVESGKLKLAPDYIDLKEFAFDCVDELKHLSEIHKLNLSYNSIQSKFLLDQKLLKFIFSNLISNAIKFSPDGGKVDVDISTTENFLILQVTDQGIGVRQEDSQKIFDSFYRSKEAENISGNGLGLAIVKRAVDLHKGEIKVNSIINKGTSFTVRLPLNN